MRPTQIHIYLEFSKFGREKKLRFHATISRCCCRPLHSEAESLKLCYQSLVSWGAERLVATALKDDKAVIVGGTPLS